MPTFSILIPLYNRKHCISDAIDSVLKQTFQNFEIIIYDDCSTDGSVEYVQQKYAQEISEGRIKLFYNEKNRREFYTDDLLLKHATGDYLRLLHSDDLLLPNALERSLEVAKKFNADVVHESFYLTTPENGNLKELFLKANDVTTVEKETLFSSDPIKRFNEWFTIGIDFMYNTFRRKFIIENDIFFENIDHKFVCLKWLLLSKVFVKIPDVHYVYRNSSDSLTRNMNIEEVSKFICDAIESIYKFKTLFDKVEIFQRYPRLQYIAYEHFLDTVMYWRVLRNGFFEHGVTPQIYDVVKSAFQKYYGETDWFFPAFLFNYLNESLLRKLTKFVAVLSKKEINIVEPNRNGITDFNKFYGKEGILMFTTIVRRNFFGRLSDGREVEIYTLDNSLGTKVEIITYGARLVSFVVPDKNQNSTDVLLGYDNIAAYEVDKCYLGGIIGRFANRIANAEFKLNDKIYHLDKNDGSHKQNHIHGGFNSFGNQLWNAEIINNGVKLTYFSKDGEGGYPGNLTAIVTYTLIDDELIIDYEATSDADTICNLTNHAYFNLNGFSSGSILNQKMQIFADSYTWADSELLPDGRIFSVENTPLDFRKLTVIGQRINDNFDQLIMAGGYDHNWIITGAADVNGLKKAAYASSDETGIELTVYTNLPGIQFYSGNSLSGDIVGKKGVRFEKHSGFCLETQYFPNSPNNANFAQPILRKGEIWRAKTIFKIN